MIEVQGLTKHYGAFTAIRDVTFDVAPGEIVGFLGPNGAGKSTTMRILACFMPPSAGTARVAGYDVFSQSMDVRRRIGYLPENVPLYTDMRVAPYLDFVAEIKGVGRATRKRRVPDVLEVRDVLTADGTAGFAVEAARDRDVRGEIFQLATERRWRLLELRRVGMTLEEVFIRIVAGEDTEVAAATAEPVPVGDDVE